MTNLGWYGTDYNTRAFIAYAGLGALTSDDAVYPSAFVDNKRPARIFFSLIVTCQTLTPMPPRSSGMSELPEATDRMIACAITRIARAQPIQ